MGHAVGGCAGTEEGTVTPEQLRQLKGLIRAGAGAEWAAADAAYQRVEQMALRDWAVRVLDAWAESDDGLSHTTAHLIQGHRSFARVELESCQSPSDIRAFEAASPDAARLAAAESIWPELPESVRAELGERP